MALLTSTLKKLQSIKCEYYGCKAIYKGIAYIFGEAHDNGNIELWDDKHEYIVNIKPENYQYLTEYKEIVAPKYEDHKEQYDEIDELLQGAYNKPLTPKELTEIWLTGHGFKIGDEITVEKHSSLSLIITGIRDTGSLIASQKDKYYEHTILPDEFYCMEKIEPKKCDRQNCKFYDENKLYVGCIYKLANPFNDSKANECLNNDFKHFESKVEPIKEPFIDWTTISENIINKEQMLFIEDVYNSISPSEGYLVQLCDIIYDLAKRLENFLTPPHINKPKPEFVLDEEEINTLLDEIEKVKETDSQMEDEKFLMALSSGHLSQDDIDKHNHKINSKEKNTVNDFMNKYRKNPKEVIKVKILKCKDKTLWYKNEIGKVFDVKIDGNSYWVTNNLLHLNEAYINPKDCEILKPVSPDIKPLNYIGVKQETMSEMCDAIFNKGIDSDKAFKRQKEADEKLREHLQEKSNNAIVEEFADKNKKCDKIDCKHFDPIASYNCMLLMRTKHRTKVCLDNNYQYYEGKVLDTYIHKNCFTLSENELNSAKVFRDRHKECYRNTGTIEVSHFNYIFTETGIGNLVKIKCRTCGKKMNITDEGSW